jgi:broad specificity phosphatase PhoE
MGSFVGDLVAGLSARDGRRPRAVVVSHNGSIAIFCSHVLGLSWGSLRILPQYTSVSVLVASGDRMVVQSLADITHLAGAGTSVRPS